MRLIKKAIMPIILAGCMMHSYANEQNHLCYISVSKADAMNHKPGGLLQATSMHKEKPGQIYQVILPKGTAFKDVKKGSVMFLHGDVHIVTGIQSSPKGYKVDMKNTGLHITPDNVHKAQ